LGDTLRRIKKTSGADFKIRAGVGALIAVTGNVQMRGLLESLKAILAKPVPASCVIIN
jgi:hypothetical protein